MNLPPPPPGAVPQTPERGGGGMSILSSSGLDVVSPKPTSGSWEKLFAKSGYNPSTRSLHAAAIWNDNMLVFGGYDGATRVNDLHAFNFTRQTWTMLAGGGNGGGGGPFSPSPRDRHVAVVWGNGFYVFGGFDGLTRVNDLTCFDMDTQVWTQVVSLRGTPPTPRHSHAAVVYHDSMYVFGGYDGSYKSDFHEFSFLHNVWTPLPPVGEVPRPRYRGTTVTHSHYMILHGGHDGNRHLQDSHLFDFDTHTWSTLITQGPVPLPRDSHVAVVNGDLMFIFGGSTGAAMGDFHELDLDAKRWSEVSQQGVFVPRGGGGGGASMGVGSSSRNRVGIGASSPAAAAAAATAATTTTAAASVAAGEGGVAAGAMMGGIEIDGDDPGGDETPRILLGGSAFQSSTGGGGGRGEVVVGRSRFCHVGVCYGNALYVFGGYDGTHRLNDFLRFQFHVENPLVVPPPSLIGDLKRLVNSDLLSDITFIVEGSTVYGHKVLCLRCPYFHNMLTGEYMESKATSLTIDDVRLPIFLLFIEFLYTDCVEVTVDSAMELFQLADRFTMERLKRMCEHVMLAAIK